MSGQFAEADRIGALRVWMDARGVDVLVAAGPQVSSASAAFLVIGAGGIVHKADRRLLGDYLRATLKPGQVLAAVGVKMPLRALVRSANAEYLALGRDELANLGTVLAGAGVSLPALHR